MIYLGSAIFKIARLLFVAMFSVHMFACVFYRVKIVSAHSPEDVAAFYISKNAASNVRLNRDLCNVCHYNHSHVSPVGGATGPSTAICKRIVQYSLNGIQFFSLDLNRLLCMTSAGLLLLCSYNVHYCRLW